MDGSQNIHKDKGRDNVDVKMEDAPAPVAPMIAPSSAFVTPEITDASSSSTSNTTAMSVRLPRETPLLVKYLQSIMPKLKLFIGRCLRPRGRAPDPSKALTPEETQFVTDLCIGLLTAPKLTASQLKDLNLKNTLMMMIAGTFEARQTAFPVEAQNAAKAAIRHFEAEEWGKKRSASPPLSPTTGQRRRDSLSTTPRRASAAHSRRASGPQSPLAPQPTGVSRHAPANHPIYGDNGIMRGIERSSGGKTASYTVVRRYGQDHHNFGHNGLHVGDWWPLQVCTLRDGAHGSRGGGMSHTADTGVRSIVTNSAYEDTDDDQGDILYYAMPGSNDNKDPDSIGKGIKATDAMRLTQALGKDIRVIRGSGAGWEGRPTVGLRYDGLYHITEEQTRRNSKGGMYVRFKLERNPGQPSLDSVRSRPTAQEIQDEARVKDGYY